MRKNILKLLVLFLVFSLCGCSVLDDLTGKTSKKDKVNNEPEEKKPEVTETPTGSFVNNDPNAEYFNLSLDDVSIILRKEFSWVVEDTTKIDWEDGNDRYFEVPADSKLLKTSLNFGVDFYVCTNSGEDKIYWISLYSEAEIADALKQSVFKRFLKSYISLYDKKTNQDDVLDVYRTAFNNQLVSRVVVACGNYVEYDLTSNITYRLCYINLKIAPCKYESMEALLSSQPYINSYTPPKVTTPSENKEKTTTDDNQKQNTNDTNNNTNEDHSNDQNENDHNNQNQGH